MITRKQLKMVVTLLLVLYVIIFAARFGYDVFTFADPSISDNYYFPGPKSSTTTSNVASFRKEYIGATAGSVEVVEQKYEQIASVTTKTIAFDEDMIKLNSVIEQAQAVVQTELSQGLPGSRTLTRVIGVKPQYFDGCLEEIKDIGMLISISSQKTDKTYEYRQMVAYKQELEKRLESYVSLRERSGSIQEMLNLEDKIIEVESLLLQQAVDLGEYSDENALCTINILWHEGNPASTARIIWNSFKWTNLCYFAILAGIIFICMAAVIIVKTYLFLVRILTSSSPIDEKPEKTDEEESPLSFS
ncbi:MAG: DUF4349 domain-containing protein [Clostridiales bacterium]|nr:DUF4349 domain-containing protein [Clostridiales bacterium]